MKNNSGIIGIIALIAAALVIGSAATYWYVEKGIPDSPQLLDITYKDVPKDGDDVPYQPIVPPEPPAPIDPMFQVYEDSVVKFQYPKSWNVEVEETGLVLRDSANASSTIIWNTAGTSFPDAFKSCLTATPVTVQGKDTTIEFLCDSTNNKATKDTIWIVADTQHGSTLYGSVSKKTDGEARAAYVEAFTHVLTTLEFKTN